mmetsp:Transcript_436/g.811  ORF Transcript_436/g.811 Transcript_436/m.811 type:complete len:537 (+) Transcript_436:471-2081(+)
MLHERAPNDNDTTTLGVGSGEKTFPTREAIEIKTLIATMCHQASPNNFSRDLYNRYCKVLDQHLSTVVSPSIERSRKENMTIMEQVHYLQTFLVQWQEFEFLAKWMKTFFRVLDRQSGSVFRRPPLRHAALQYFDEHILQPNEETIHQAVLSLIQYDRVERDRTSSAARTDETKVKSRHWVTETCECLDSIYAEMETLEVLVVPEESSSTNLEQLSQHHHHHHNRHPRATNLERLFWRTTREYYAQQRQKQLKQTLVQNEKPYHVWAKEAMENEHERAADYLHILTSEKILEDMVHEELIAKASTPKPSSILPVTKPTEELIGFKIDPNLAKSPSWVKYIPIVGFLMKRRRQRKLQWMTAQAQKHVDPKKSGKKKKTAPNSSSISMVSTPASLFAKDSDRLLLMSSDDASLRSVTSCTEDSTSRHSSPARSVQSTQDDHISRNDAIMVSDRVLSLREKNKKAQGNLQALLGKSFNDNTTNCSRDTPEQYSIRCRQGGDSIQKVKRLASLKRKHNANATKVQDLIKQLRDGNELVEG